MKSIRVGPVRVDVLTQKLALDAIDDLYTSGRGGRVFTPNVDHVVLAEENHAFRAAYQRAELSLADGFPIVLVSKWSKTPLPEKISGSDLVMPLMSLAAERGRSVYLFGGAEGVAEKARDLLLAKLPNLKVVGTSAPRISLECSDEELFRLVEPIREAQPSFVLVALGAPKQELVIDRVAKYLAPAVLLGIGASLDFIAGTQKRAPGWMAKNGLEWLHRLSHDRERLWKRYLLRDTKFPLILARHALATRFGRPA